MNLNFRNIEFLLKDNSVRAYLKNITNDLGLVEVPDADADYKIVLKPIGQVAKHKKGYYQGDVSVEVSIVDVKNRREIYSYRLPQTNLKVEKPDLALVKSFHRSVNRSEKFLVEFITALCALHL